MSRVIDTNNRIKIIALICITIILMLLLAPAQILAAESETEMETETQTTKTYTITFSAGGIAEFRDGLADEYEALKGTNGIVDVVQSEATGNIKITVEAISPMPNAPDNTDIVFKDEYDGQYIINTGWRPTEAIVENNETYVVDYGALIDSVEYTIEFVDADTGADVASPVITIGNAGETVTYTAKTVTGFEYDELIKEIELTETAENNIITFYYTNITGAEVVTNTVTTPGDVIIVPGAGATEIAEEAVPAAAEEAAEDVTTIEEDATPLEDGQDSITIDEDEVPLYNGISTPNTVLFSAILVIATALIIMAIALYNRRKKQKAE